MSKSQRTIIYLLRHDLRLQDNPVFQTISSAHRRNEITHLVPLFVFNPIQYEISGLLQPGETSPFAEARSRLGQFWRCGPYRVRFLVESLFDLKASLKDVGSDLIIRAGETHTVINNMIQGLNKEDCEIKGVWITGDHASEEVVEAATIRRSLPDGIPLKEFEDESMLITRSEGCHIQEKSILILL